MKHLRSLLLSAASGDTAAYDRIVSRFRDMAYSYAYSIIRDFHLAEDVTQEAFVQAFYDLPKLREPLAFPGWLRRIVLKQCDRLTRRRHVPVVPLEEAVETPSREAGPGQLLEDRERHASVLSAIGALPDREREVTLLFYIRDYSQREIADFLQVPVTTVNSRLQEARKRLRGRMMAMVEKIVKEYRLPETFRVAIKRPSATKTAAPSLIWFQDRWVMVWQDGVRGDPWDHPFWFLLSESPDGKQWSEPRRIDLPPQIQQLPRLCVFRDELVMHTHDWHGGMRVARSRDLQQWSDVQLQIGVAGRGGPFARGSTLFVSYARWMEIDSIGDSVEVLTSTDGVWWRWLTSPCPSHGAGITQAIGLATEDRLYVFWGEHPYVPEGEPESGHEAYVSWSDDDGTTWSAPVRVDPLSPPEPPKGATPVTAALTPDGRLVVVGDAGREQTNAQARLAISRDRGQTWPERATIPIGSLQDCTIAFAPDGTLLVAGSSPEDSETRPVVLHSRLER
jgi:RNA polymerase sigma factor (sigma-70 family)